MLPTYLPTNLPYLSYRPYLPAYLPSYPTPTLTSFLTENAASKEYVRQASKDHLAYWQVMPN